MLGVRVLGPVDLLHDGVVRSIERIQVRRLLAVLVSDGARHWSTDELIEELWADGLPVNPVGALQVVASRLRNVFDGDGDRLVRSGGGYRLDLPTDAVDSWRLDAVVGRRDEVAGDEATRLNVLDRALAAWRGTPFVDAPGPPALDGAARRLEELRGQAEEERCALLVRSGRPALAVAAGLGLVTERKTRESMARIVAGALALDGRPADALRLITATRRALADELGIEPGEALRATEAAILRDEPPLPELAPFAHVAASNGRSAQPATTIVGREPEQLALARAPDPGRGRFVLLSGEPGIGKSALVSALAARDDVVTLLAECAPPEDDGALPEAVGGGRVDATAPIPAAARDLVAALGARVDAIDLDVMVVIDDAQWAGPVTLAALRMMARRPLAGVSVVVAHRPPDTDSAPNFAATLEACAASPLSETVALGPLDAECLARLADVPRVARAQRRRIGEFLARLTGGNPFLATTLLRAGITQSIDGRDGLPAALELALDARLAQLPPDATRLLEIITIEPSGIDPTFAAAVADYEPAECGRLVHLARRAGLLRHAPGGRIIFDHDLLRIALSMRMTEYEIAALHARAAEVFAELGGSDIDVARHIAQAGDLVEMTTARTRLLAGAEGALAAGRFDLAAELFAAAARREADYDVRLRHAIALESAGRRREAATSYDTLLTEALSVGDTAGAARAALGGDLHGGTVGGDAQRIARLRSSVDTPPEDDALHLRVIAAYAREIAIADRDIPHPLLQRAHELVRDNDDDGLALRAAIDAARIAARPVTKRSLQRAEDLVFAAARAGERELVLRGLELRTALLLAIGDFDAAIASKSALDDAVSAYPLPRYRWSCSLFDAAFVDLRHGPIAGDAAAREALAVGTDLEIPDALNAYSMFRISVSLRDGTLAPLVGIIDRFVQGPTSIPAWHAVFAAALAGIEGRAEEAADQLRLFARAYDSGVIRFPDVGLVFAADAAVAIGDEGQGRWLVPRLAQWKGRLAVAGVGAGVYGPTDWWRARVAEMLGDGATAEAARASAARAVKSPHAAAWESYLGACV